MTQQTAAQCKGAPAHEVGGIDGSGHTAPRRHGAATHSPQESGPAASRRRCTALHCTALHYTAPHSHRRYAASRAHRPAPHLPKRRLQLRHGLHLADALATTALGRFHHEREPHHLRRRHRLLQRAQVCKHNPRRAAPGPKPHPPTHTDTPRPPSLVENQRGNARERGKGTGCSPVPQQWALHATEELLHTADASPQQPTHALANRLYATPPQYP